MIVSGKLEAACIHESVKIHIFEKQLYCHEEGRLSCRPEWMPLKSSPRKRSRKGEKVALKRSFKKEIK